MDYTTQGNCCLRPRCPSSVLQESIHFLSINFNLKPYYDETHAKMASAKNNLSWIKSAQLHGLFSGLKYDATTQKLCDKADENNYLFSNVQTIAESVIEWSR